MRKLFSVFGSPSGSKDSSTQSSSGSSRSREEEELSSQILSKSAQNLTLGLSEVVQEVLTSSQRSSNLGIDVLGQGSPFVGLLDLLDGDEMHRRNSPAQAPVASNTTKTVLNGAPSPPPVSGKPVSTKGSSDIQILLDLRSNQNFVRLCTVTGLASALMNALRVLRMLEIKLASGPDVGGAPRPSLPSSSSSSGKSDESAVAVTFFASKNACAILEALCSDSTVVESLKLSLVKLCCFPLGSLPASALHLQVHSGNVISCMARRGLSTSLVWFLHDKQAVEIMVRQLQELIVERESPADGAPSFDCMLRGLAAEENGMWIRGLACLADLITHACSLSSASVLISDLESAGGVSLLVDMVTRSAPHRAMRMMSTVIRIFMDESSDTSLPLTHGCIGSILVQVLKQSLLQEDCVKKSDSVTDMEAKCEDMFAKREHIRSAEHIIQAISYNLLTLYSNHAGNLTMLEDEHCFLPTLILSLSGTRDTETMSAVIMTLNYTVQATDGQSVMAIIGTCACMSALLKILFKEPIDSEIYRESHEKLTALSVAAVDVVKSKKEYGMTLLRCGFMKHLLLWPFERLGECLGAHNQEQLQEYDDKHDVFCTLLASATSLLDENAAVAAEMRRGNLYQIVRTLIASERIPEKILISLLSFNEVVARTDEENVIQHLFTMMDLIHVMLTNRLRTKFLLGSLFNIVSGHPKSGSVLKTLNESPVLGTVLSSLNSTFEQDGREDEKQACYDCIVTLFELLPFSLVNVPKYGEPRTGNKDYEASSMLNTDGKTVKETYAEFGRGLVGSCVFTTPFAAQMFDKVFDELVRNRAAIAMVLALLPSLSKDVAVQLVARLGAFIREEPSSVLPSAHAEEIGYIENVLTVCSPIINDDHHALSGPLIDLVLTACTHRIHFGDFCAILRQLVHPRIVERGGGLLPVHEVPAQGASDDDWRVVDALEKLTSDFEEAGNPTSLLSLTDRSLVKFTCRDLSDALTFSAWVRVPADASNDGRDILPLMALSVGKSVVPVVEVGLHMARMSVLVCTSGAGGGTEIMDFFCPFFSMSGWNMVTVCLKKVMRKTKQGSMPTSEVSVFVNGVVSRHRDLPCGHIDVTFAKPGKVNKHFFSMGSSRIWDELTFPCLRKWYLSSVHVFNGTLTRIQVANMYMKKIGYVGLFQAEAPLADGLITLATNILLRSAGITMKVSEHMDKMGYRGLETVVEPWVLDNVPSFELEQIPVPAAAFCAVNAIAVMTDVGAGTRGLPSDDEGDGEYEPNIRVLSHVGDRRMQLSDANLVSQTSLADYIAGLGGPTILMPLLRAACTEDRICKVLRLILRVTKANESNMKMMQKQGYRVVAYVLHSKPRDVITPRVMDMILDFTVTRFTDPSRVLLVDSLAMVHLVMNHQIWDMDNFANTQRVTHLLHELATDDFFGYINCSRLYNMGGLSWLLMLLLAGVDNCGGTGVIASTSQSWKIACPDLEDIACGSDKQNDVLRQMVDTVQRLIMTGGIRNRDLELISNALVYSLGDGSADQGNVADSHNLNHPQERGLVGKATPLAVLRNALLRMLCTYHDRSSFASSKDTQSIFRNILKPNWFLVVIGNPNADVATVGQTLRLLGMMLEQDLVFLKSFVELSGFHALECILGTRRPHLATVLPIVGILFRIPLQYIPSPLEVTSAVKITRLVDLEETLGPFMTEAETQDISTPLLVLLLDNLELGCRTRTMWQTDEVPMVNKVIAEVLCKSVETCEALKYLVQSKAVVAKLAHAIVLCSDVVDPFGSRLLDVLSPTVSEDVGLSGLVKEEYAVPGGEWATVTRTIEEGEEIWSAWEERPMNLTPCEGQALANALEVAISDSLLRFPNPDVPLYFMLAYPNVMPVAALRAYQTLVFARFKASVGPVLELMEVDSLSCVVDAMGLFIPAAKARLIDDAVVFAILQLHFDVMNFVETRNIPGSSKLAGLLGESTKTFALIVLHSSACLPTSGAISPDLLGRIVFVRQHLRVLCTPYTEEGFEVLVDSKRGSAFGGGVFDMQSILTSTNSRTSIGKKTISQALGAGAAERRRIAQAFIVSTFCLAYTMLSGTETSLRDEGMKLCQYLLMVCPNYIFTFVSNSYQKARKGDLGGDEQSLEGLPVEVILEGLKMLRPSETSAEEFDNFLRSGADGPSPLAENDLSSTFTVWMAAHSEEMALILGPQVSLLMQALPRFHSNMHLAYQQQRLRSDSDNQVRGNDEILSKSKRMRIFRQIYLFTRASIRQWLLVGTSKLATGGKLWVQLCETMKSGAEPTSTSPGCSDSNSHVWAVSNFMAPEKAHIKLEVDRNAPERLLRLRAITVPDANDESSANASSGTTPDGTSDLSKFLSDIAKVGGIKRTTEIGGPEDHAEMFERQLNEEGTVTDDAANTNTTTDTDPASPDKTRTAGSLLSADNDDVDGTRDQEVEGAEEVDLEAAQMRGVQGASGMPSVADGLLCRSLPSATDDPMSRVIAMESSAWLTALCHGLIGTRAWSTACFFNVRRISGLTSRGGLLVVTNENIHLFCGLSFDPVPEPSRYLRMDKVLVWKSPQDEAMTFETSDESQRQRLQENRPLVMSAAWKREVWQHLLQPNLGQITMSLASVHSFFRLRHELKYTALEIYDAGKNSSLLFSAGTESEATEIISVLMERSTPRLIFNRSGVTNLQKAMRGQAMVHGSMVQTHLTAATRLWQRGELTNFDYLMHLNLAAGRSFHDLTQYPVFPWILADYESTELDLTKPSTFRDLAKPMGALGEKRAQQFLERFESLDQAYQEDESSAPPFFYGTHYSCTGYVLHYLLRLQPYTGLHMNMQGGHLDKADRLFRSVGDSWRSASKENIQDVRELTPEFYCLPDFLINRNRFHFGTTQKNEAVDDVELPPWAKGDASVFIRKQREALESPYVSEHLHHWIDLIFGYKQRGDAAVEARNLFIHITYDGAVDIDAITDPVLREATLAQINSFGQTPSQLFRRPHPKRTVPDAASVTAYGVTVDPAALAWHDSVSPPLCVVGAVNKTGFAEVNLLSLAKDYTDPGWCAGPVGDVVLVGKELQSLGQGAVFIPGRLNRFIRFKEAAAGVSIFSQVMQGNRQSVSVRLSTLDTQTNKYRISGSYEDMHARPITCIASAVGSETLVTGSADMSVRIWSLRRIERSARKIEHMCTLQGHTGTVLCVHHCPSMHMVVSGGADQSAIIWDVQSQTLHRFLHGHNGAVIGVSMNRINGHVFTLTRSELRLYTVNGDLLVKQEFRDADYTRSVAGASALCAVPCADWREGIVVVTGHMDGAVLLWTLSHGQLRICRGLSDTHTAEITVIRLQANGGVDTAALKLPVDKTYLSASAQHLLVGDAEGCCSRWGAQKLDQDAAHMLPTPLSSGAN